jgi:NAD-dependent histone deacetylase SIR2
MNITGAGVSVQAGIPDFRSADGLFQQLKKEHPKEGLSSGRELFDASVFHSESTASIFYKMIARLARLVEHAEPTPFHEMLKGLDDRGQLLRCYTQNIDGIEEKAGLSLGVPVPLTPKRSPRKSKKKEMQSVPDGSTSTLHSLPPSPSPVSTPPPTPVIDDTPRCIPLHGTLKTLHCPTCGATASLSERASSFEDGSAPSCVQCSEFEHTRQLVGKRLRGVGVMRPSIVLYNEDHREGERVGDMVKRDLTGGKTKRAPPDLLLVAGTSLRVPGTKRIVKEFSKAARSGVSGGNGNGNANANANGESRSSSPAGGDDDRPIRTIYLNLDFPMPAREWESTFDVWVQGDVQEFVRRVREAMNVEDGARKLREERSIARLATAGEKRKRDKEEDVGTRSLELAMDASSISTAGGKRRKLVPVIQRPASSLIASSPFKRKLVEPEPRDVFGPVVVPTAAFTQQPQPQRSSGIIGPVEVRTNVSCGIQRRHSLVYPLGGISATPSPGELWRATVLGESRRVERKPDGPIMNGPLCDCLHCA